MKSLSNDLFTSGPDGAGSGAAPHETVQSDDLSAQRHIGYPNRMRVLFVIHELALNGAVTSLLHQTRHMVAKGDHVTIGIPRLSGPAEALLPLFLEAGAKLVRTMPWEQHDITVGCTVFAASGLNAWRRPHPTALWVHEGRAGVEMVTKSPDARHVGSQREQTDFP